MPEVFRLGREGRLLGETARLGGRRAEFDLEMESWAVLERACSSAIRESIASRRRCGVSFWFVTGAREGGYLEHCRRAVT